MNKSLSVLVVDDDEKIGDMIGEFLREEGHQVVPVTSGQKALEAYKNRPFDVVVLDMILPEMDGLEIMKRLKRMDSNVRVVAMTGFSVLGMLESAARIGVTTTLFKPFHIEQLKEAIILSLQAKLRQTGDYPYCALLVDREGELLHKLVPQLNELGFVVKVCQSLLEAQSEVKYKEYDLIMVGSTANNADEEEKVTHYIEDCMSMSKCVMHVGKSSDIGKVVQKIGRMFREK